jgi:hypothetical protein
MIPLLVWIVLSVVLLVCVALGFRSQVVQMFAGWPLDDLFMVSLFELAFGVGLWVMAGLVHEIVSVGANVMSVFVCVLGVAVVYSHLRPFVRRLERDDEEWRGGLVE